MKPGAPSRVSLAETRAEIAVGVARRRGRDLCAARERLRGVVAYRFAGSRQRTSAMRPNSQSTGSIGFRPFDAWPAAVKRDAGPRQIEMKRGAKQDAA